MQFFIFDFTIKRICIKSDVLDTNRKYFIEKYLNFYVVISLLFSFLPAGAIERGATAYIFQLSFFLSYLFRPVYH